MSPIRFILIFLTFFSIWVGLKDIYFYEGLSPKYQVLFNWCDIYFSYIFLMDLVVRFIIRDRQHCPTLWKFILKNWFDIIPLLFEIPNTFVYPFPLWVLKLFRLIRLYKRLTEEQVLIFYLVYCYSYG